MRAKNAILLLITSTILILSGGCDSGATIEEAGDELLGNVEVGGECGDSSECADGLICIDGSCIETEPINGTIDPEDNTDEPPCLITGTLSLPSGIDATGEQYTIVVDGDASINYNEAAMQTETWTSGDTHEYIIDVANVPEDTYYLYAAINVAGVSYIGYLGGVDIAAPGAVNATIACDAIFDIALAPVTIPQPDYEITASVFPLSGIGNRNFAGEFDITNVGDVAGSVSLDWKVYLSNNNLFEISQDALVGTGSIAALGIDETFTNIGFSGTWLASGGGKYLIILISASDDINSSNDLLVSSRIQVAPIKRAIAVGSNGVILYSDDLGATWNFATSGTTSILRDVASDSNGRWVAVGYGGAALYSTDAGLTWTSSSSGTTNRLNGIVSYGPGKFVAVGEPTGPDPVGIIRSFNAGETWETRYTTIILNDITARGDNDLVAVGRTASTHEGCAFISYTGGYQWGPPYCSLASSNTLYAVTYTMASYFVSVGQQISLYSSNGGIWRIGAEHPEVPTSMYGLAWSNPPGRLVSVGQSGKVMYGDSFGTSWTLVDSGTTEMLYDVASDNNGHFIAVGDDGTIIYSDDAGETWQSATSGTGEILWGVSFSQN